MTAPRDIDGIIRHMVRQERRLRALRQALDSIMTAVPGSGALPKRSIARAALLDDDAAMLADRDA